MNQLMLTILLNACWQIAVVALFATAGNWLLRGTAAWCRHTVWVAAMVISLCLPIIGGLNTLELSPVETREATHSVSENSSRPFDLQDIKPARPETTNGAAHTGTAGVPPATSEAFSAAPLESLNSASVQSNQSGRDARGPSKNERSPIAVNKRMAALLVALYALFLLYRGFKLFRAWRRTTAIMRSAHPTQVTGRAAAIVARCQTAIGVKRVRVVCSNSVQLPITAGVFNPLVMLPEELLREADEDILLSAIGHELVHVARRDYILNLVYELIYLPISFHPAAALVRRRIRQTRELCCDELVAGKLLRPELYARSLVRLVGSVPLAGRLAADTTIGITDADILEVRIMSLLKTSKLSARRNALLLIAACLLLAAPCVAAAAFAPEFEIDNSEIGIIPEQEQLQEASQRLERAREELQRKERELAELARKSSNLKGAELEKLRRAENELREASARFAREQESLHLKETEKQFREIQEKYAQIVTAYPADEARMRQAKEKLAELQRSLPESQERSRELREQFAMIEKQYSNATVMADYLAALRRAQAELAQQKEALSKEQREKIEEKMKHEKWIWEDQKHERKTRQEIEMKMRDAEKKFRNNEKIRNKEYEKLISKNVIDKVRRSESAKADRAREQAELAQHASMPMDRAIQIATSQHPGKVLSCSLGRQKDGQPHYRLVIVNGEGKTSSATHVWVSATDGRIIKTEHE